MDENFSFKIGKSVLGIAALVWGGLLIVKALSLGLFFSQPSRFSPALEGSYALDFAPGKILLSVLVPYLILALFFVSAGVGVLMRKKWGRKLLLGLSIVLLIQPLASFLIFGSFINFSWLMAQLTFAGAILWYFNIASVASSFAVTQEEVHRDRWKHLLVAVSFVFLIVGGYLFLVFSQNLERFWQPQTVEKINYRKFGMFSSEPKEEVLLLNQYHILVPVKLKMQVTSEDLDDPQFKNMLINNPDKSVAMLVDNQPIFHLYGIFGQVLGHDDPLIFGRKFLQERVGLLFLILKKMVMAGFADSDFAEIYFDNWRGLLIKHKTSQENMIYDYSLWREEKPLGIVVIIKNETLTEEEVAAMIASLSLRPE